MAREDGLLLPRSASLLTVQVNNEGINPEQNAADGTKERISSFAKAGIGITISSFSSALAGYNNINASSPLFKTGGFFLLATFVLAVILMMANSMCKQNRRTRSANLFLSILVALTCFMLTVTDLIFVANLDQGNLVLPILLSPALLSLTTLAFAEAPVLDDGAYESEMKNSCDLGYDFGVAAFAMQGGVIFGYIKNATAFGGCHLPTDLALSFFASMICIYAVTITTVPLGLLFPSTKGRLIAISKLLRYVMMAALASVAMVLAFEFLNGYVMFSFLPEVIASLVNFSYTQFFNGGGGAREAEPHGMLKYIVTWSCTLMVAVYSVYLGKENYDVYVKASMHIMMCAILSCLRQMALPFNLPTSTGKWAVVAFISVVFPGLALLISLPLMAKIFIDLFVKG